MCAHSRFDPVSGPRVCGADVEKKKTWPTALAPFSFPLLPFSHAAYRPRKVSCGPE